MIGLLRRWWRRPARTPYAMRVMLAALLGTIGLLGIVHSASGSGQVRAAPSGVAAPTKFPDQPGPGAQTVSFPRSPQLVAQGQSLYENGCAGCHGLGLQGHHGVAPSLRDAGAGPIWFYVSSGRMPLQNPDDEPERARPVYDVDQIHALIAYITSHGRGPAVSPAADPAAGNLATGLSVFTENCAGCHQVVGRGGLVIGAWVPSLQKATSLQIAEAVRMGPYLMPRFNAEQIDQSQLNSLVRYVRWTRHPDDAGGWGLFNIGPIPEGLAAWFIALLAMVIVARLIGERTTGETR